MELHGVQYTLVRFFLRLKVSELSQDHKPDLASERERIERTGGVQEVQGSEGLNSVENDKAQKSSATRRIF